LEGLQYLRKLYWMRTGTVSNFIAVEVVRVHFHCAIISSHVSCDLDNWIL